jgi:hypothetical protein
VVGEGVQSDELFPMCVDECLVSSADARTFFSDDIDIGHTWGDRRQGQ